MVMVMIVRAMATVRRVMVYFNGNMFSLHYVSRNEKTWKMKRNIYYSSAYESQEEQFGQGKLSTKKCFCK